VLVHRRRLHFLTETRLITLSISPFNELARWSLDRAGVRYVEQPQALVWHVIASRRAGGKGTTPVLVTDGEVVGESAEIAEWADRHAGADRRLYPEGAGGEEARALVTLFVTELGPQARRVIWGHLVNDPALAHRYWGQRVSARQRRVQPWLLRFGKIGIRRALVLDKSAVEAAPGRVRAIFDEVGERLADGRRHILGDEFSVADIAFAAMASPAILPDEGYPAKMPRPEEFPEPVAETIRSLRAHPAGEYALRLYREQRG
jgi:glutathione S-transferase